MVGEARSTPGTDPLGRPRFFEMRSSLLPRRRRRPLRLRPRPLRYAPAYLGAVLRQWGRKFRLGGLAWPALIAAAVVAVLVTIVVRERQGGNDPVSDRPARAANHDLGFAPLQGWNPSAKVPRLEGMEFRDPIVLEEPVSGMRLVAGLLPATSQTLLPPEFMRHLRIPAAKPETIGIGDGIKANYYAGLSPADIPGLVDVYVAPTTAGILTVACVAGTGVVAPYYDCWRNVSTLTLRRGRALRLGADAAFRQRLPHAVAAIDSARQHARSELAIRVPAQQAMAASDVAAAYHEAAASLAPLAPSSERRAQAIVRELAGAERAYRDVAAALQTADGARFEVGQDAVHQREHRIKQLLDRPSTD
jgi:hypothetical protein